MPDFRDKLYEQFFQNQSGRRLDSDFRTRLQEHWRQLENEILPLLNTAKEGIVLDLGCGYGELLMLLKEKGWSRSYGIDISQEQIAKAKELGLQTVEVADAFQYLAGKKESFSIITAIDIIEHFSKDELLKLLGYIQSALRPGGTAIFRTPNMDAPYTSTYAYGDFTHQSLLNYSSAEQLFRSAGFSQVEVLPSFIRTNGFMKESLRKTAWFFISGMAKLTLFASGKSTRGVYFTPNLIIRVKK
jgi:2-polyprenyl-3-methyl-5-hydroxy-6-metoxy-1,4-benzoquinol methylase